MSIKVFCKLTSTGATAFVKILMTKLCKIYKNRPLVCDVDAYYEKFLSKLMSRAEFHEINYKVCESLRGAENV